MAQTTDTGSVRVDHDGGTETGSRAGSAGDIDLDGALEAMLSANRDLRHELERYEAMLLDGAEKVEAGASLCEALADVPPLSARRATEAAITRLFEARHRLRRAVVYAVLREGMTIDAIAATLEVSAHMVCAIAAETPFRSDCPGGRGVDAISACQSSGVGPCTC